MKCIRINQIKLSVGHSPEELKTEIIKCLNIKPENFVRYEIVRKSVDARRKPDIKFVYSLNVYLVNYKKVSKKVFRQNVSMIEEETYQFKVTGQRQLKNRPVIVGMGPAGLFCGYYLAKHGYCPIILDRGEDVDARGKTVDRFWETGILDTESNVQFGEGGAGTFSDGKLNTLVKDKSGRNRVVLDTFVAFGAKEEICFENKPHIGTDALRDIVKNMREEIIRLGAEVRFGAKMTDIWFEQGAEGKRKVAGIEINNRERLETECLILAIGHSARDTLEMLYEKNLFMTQKAFAVGLRIEHPQSMINYAMYGTSAHELLEAADYKVTYNTPEHGIYSFCMCPGGYVVNASSEKGRLAVNGMSYSDRAGENANSAVVVTVSPQDYGKDHVLNGMYFQRKLEERAYLEGEGKILVQCLKDFCEGRATTSLGEVKPAVKGGWKMANLRSVLPVELSKLLIQGIHGFSRQVAGFDRPDALLFGVETRTSSPVRLERDEHFYSVGIEGVYPCGEGAGYAGGITSAAMDGLRIAEAAAAVYMPINKKN